ncbi:MAG TPA: hypothetical protein VIX20_02185 [Ktedonobacteraceae bacterium]
MGRHILRVHDRTILLRKVALVWRPDKIHIKNFGALNYAQLLGKALVLLLALLLAACSSSTLATSKPTPTTPPIFPTSGPVEQAPASGSVEIKFTLVEFRITSSVTAFHAGTHYYFVVSNRGHDTHEFMIMPDKPDGSPLSPDEQYKSMLMELEPITPGTTWATNFTFSAPGKYEIACQMGRHYQAGMRLPITVNK